MPREPKPWFRSSADAWYVCIQGKQHRLARGKANRAEALAAYHRLMAGQITGKDPDRLTVAELCESFLGYVQRSRAPRTYETYRRHLKSFNQSAGGLAVRDVRRKHLTRWLAEHSGWSDSTRNGAITAVCLAFNWAAREGHIDRSPLRSIPRPPIARRERLLTREEIQAIRADVRDQEFRDFLTALVESGCRPGEAAQVEAKDIDLEAGSWTIAFKGNPRRTVYLTPVLVEVCRRLMALHPTGPIFLNSKGKPWTKGKYGDRIRLLRRRLGLGEDVTAYLIRHAFATDALDRGIPDATVAELLGHKGTNMLHRFYSKLRDKKDHLRAALNRVRPSEEPEESGEVP
jgi:integrase